MTDHTPGPWRATENLIQGYMATEAATAPLRPTIALVCTTTTSAGANAALIAAAPDLLAALEELTTELAFRDGPCVENCGCNIDTARAAIAAARGA